MSEVTVLSPGQLFKLEGEGDTLFVCERVVPANGRPLSEPYVRGYKLEGTVGRYRKSAFRSPALSKCIPLGEFLDG